MDTQRISYLFNQYQNKSSTVSELEEFKKLVNEPEFENQFKFIFDSNWGNLRNDELQSLPVDIEKEQFNYIIKQSRKTETFVKLWPRIAIAAAMAIIILGGGLFYFDKNTTQKLYEQSVYESDIAPGKQGATLTLANGKKIKLSNAANGELARESGIVITKSADGQLIYEITAGGNQVNKINTLSTTNGETYKVRLPDGSLAWLNAASTLTYAANLNENGKRNVKLEGEAYFEIKRDELHPFVVESKGQEVEVLGTHFNVNAYIDEPAITTTLLEGSVRITSGVNKQLIRAGEQVQNYGSELKVSKANVENITDWKEGDFYLNQLDFKTAMRKIARWYDVEIIYDIQIPNDLESGGWISRSNNLSAVLKAIEATGLARFRIDGKKIHVYK